MRYEWLPGHLKRMYTMFDFLYESRKKPIPIDYKILFDHSKLTKNDLVVERINLGGIEMEFTLPSDLHVRFSVYLKHSNINILPKNLYVGDNLYIKGTKIRELPVDLIVEEDIIVAATELGWWERKYPKFNFKT